MEKPCTVTLAKSQVKNSSILSNQPLLCKAGYGMLNKREKDTCLFEEDNA